MQGVQVGTGSLPTTFVLQNQVWVVLIGDALKEQYVYLKSRILKT